MQSNSHEIDAATLQSWLEMGRAVEVIDIRPRDDYEAWHVPGSHNVDAYHAIHARRPGPLADYQAPADTPVVAVCFVGQTSRAAAEYLRTRGMDAVSLAGGMSAWSLAWNTAEVPLGGAEVQVLQVRRTGKGCLSYLVASDGEALVIDASLDPQVYLDLAGGRGWRVTKVLDTHVHADHLSRSRLLAEKAGAEHMLPEQRRVRFEFTPIRDGEALSVGAANLEARRTPGHTDESTSFLLPGQALFTGDTLFLEGVGRPDLMAGGGETEQRANALHQTLAGLARLDPGLLVLPGHTGKPVPFDHAPLAAPLGEVLGRLGALRLGQEAFVSWLLGRIPPAPPNHASIIAFNEAGGWPHFDPVALEAGANQCAVA